MIKNYKSGQEISLLKKSNHKITENFVQKYKSQNIVREAHTNYLKAESLNKYAQYEFLYKDRDCKQLVKVSFLYSVKKMIYIHMDYNSFFKDIPAYGLWQRIDEFMCDVLTCWPEHIFKDYYSEVIVTGGWRSGVWCSNFKRIINARKSLPPDKMKECPCIEPFLDNIGYGRSYKWNYVDCENADPEVKLDFETDSLTGRKFFSASKELSGFQGRVPYLQREDGRAVIFPCKLEPSSWRGEDPTAHLWYTYADDDIFFSFRSSSIYNLELMTIYDFGFRHQNSEDHFFSSTPYGDEKIFGAEENSPYAYLSFRGWKKAKAALMDAWPAWAQQKTVPWKVIKVDPSNLPKYYGFSAIVGAFGPEISKGFSGGYSESWYGVLYSDETGNLW